MCHRGAAEDLERIRAQERDDKAKAAMETAKERGLELPPMVEKKVESGSGTASEMSREDGSGSDGVDDDAVEGDAGISTDLPKEDGIGKGLFDGW